MGMPKALAEWRGQTFLGSLLDVYLPYCAQVIVVAGAHADAIRPHCREAELIINPSPERGQYSSLQCGLAALAASARLIFFQPVDAPGIAAATLPALEAGLGGHAVVAPSYQGRHGHPVLITREVAGAMLELPPDSTAREALRPFRARTGWIEVADPAVVRDFDSPDRVRSALA